VKLHWSSRSPFVRKVMICAHERHITDQIACTYSIVSLSNANAEVMRDNPLGKIPTLILDDGRVLYDSIVICEYFDGLGHGPALFPAPGDARWLALRRHALGNGMLDTLILWRAERGKPQSRQTPEWLVNFGLKTRNALGVIEADADALARDQFGIGHVGIGVALAYLDFRFGDIDWRASHPRTDQWMRSFLARESVHRTAFIDA
jgi:glutathione S-transferase